MRVYKKRFNYQNDYDVGNKVRMTLNEIVNYTGFSKTTIMKKIQNGIHGKDLLKQKSLKKDKIIKIDDNLSMTIKEIADYIDVSITTVLRRIRKGVKGRALLLKKYRIKENNKLKIIDVEKKSLLRDYNEFEQTQDDIVLVMDKDTHKLMWTTIDQFDDPEIANGWKVIEYLTNIKTSQDLEKLLKKLEEEEI